LFIQNKDNVLSALWVINWTNTLSLPGNETVLWHREGGFKGSWVGVEAEKSEYRATNIRQELVLHSSSGKT
jgi:hypothetical protein